MAYLINTAVQPALSIKNYKGLFSLISSRDALSVNNCLLFYIGLCILPLPITQNIFFFNLNYIAN